MSHILVKEQVDIFKLPQVDERYLSAPGKQISIGDLHGNTMKLLFLLVKHGIAKNLTAADYQDLVDIYKTRPLSKENLKAFNLILDKIEFNADTKIRFIGDELADRGNNDYFTLKVFEKLHKNKVPFETLASNHSIEFIEAYEIQDNFHAPMLSQGGHAPSLESLQDLGARDVVTRDEVIELTRYYKPSLKLISYSLNEDHSNITLYSHAAIGINTIKKVAEKLGVDYLDADSTELAQTIDSINEQFQKHVESNTVHTLYDRRNMEAGYSGHADLTDAPIEMLMWNRLYGEDIIERPNNLNGFSLNYVHGHDSNDPKLVNNYNLDNILGKAQSLNQGEYTVLYSTESQLIKKVLTSEEVEAIRKKAAPKFAKIDQVFKELNDKIANIDQHVYEQAHQIASEMFKQLQGARKRYESNLLAGVNDPKAGSIFKIACEKAVITAKPILIRDLSWGDYLTNLVKTIVNAVITVGTLGKYNGFFPPATSKSSEAVKVFEKDLEQINTQNLAL